MGLGALTDSIVTAVCTIKLSSALYQNVYPAQSLKTSVKRHLSFPVYFVIHVALNNCSACWRSMNYGLQLV